MSACHTVKIGKKSFRAGCGRKKREDGKRRQKPHWRPEKAAKAKKRAMKNPDFKKMRLAMPKAQKWCARTHKPFTKAFGACIKKHLKGL